MFFLSWFSDLGVSTKIWIWASIYSMFSKIQSMSIRGLAHHWNGRVMTCNNHTSEPDPVVFGEKHVADNTELLFSQGPDNSHRNKLTFVSSLFTVRSLQGSSLSSRVKDLFSVRGRSNCLWEEEGLWNVLLNRSDHWWETKRSDGKDATTQYGVKRSC